MPFYRQITLVGAFLLCSLLTIGQNKTTVRFTTATKGLKAKVYGGGVFLGQTPCKAHLFLDNVDELIAVIPYHETVIIRSEDIIEKGEWNELTYEIKCKKIMSDVPLKSFLPLDFEGVIGREVDLSKITATGKMHNTSYLKQNFNLANKRVEEAITKDLSLYFDSEQEARYSIKGEVFSSYSAGLFSRSLAVFSHVEWSIIDPLTGRTVVSRPALGAYTPREKVKPSNISAVRVYSFKESLVQSLFSFLSDSISQAHLIDNRSLTTVESNNDVLRLNGFEKERIVVTLHEGISMVAELIREDPETDIALLKLPVLDVLPLHVLPDVAEVGSTVYAIGTPRFSELSQTLTKGIVSAHRNEKKKMIQTDVSISPGNSGGPLVSEDGQAIGIITSKVIGEGTEGIGFAIPIGEAIEALNIELSE